MRAALMILGITVAALMTPGAHAADHETSVQQLLDACKEPVKSGLWLFCAGMVSGVGDVMSMNSQIEASGAAGKDVNLKPVSICPVGTNFPTGSAQIQAFVNWATANPQEWADRGSLGVMKALRGTWPCN